MEIPDIKDITIKSEADERVIKFQEQLGEALRTIYKAITKPIDWPKMYPISGKVSVTNFDDISSVSVENLNELEKYFKILDTRLAHLTTAISMAKEQKIEIPKIEIPRFEFPKIEIPKDKELKSTLDSIQSSLEKLGKKEFEFPQTISVDNFPPQMTPQPVTHFSMNALQGFIKTTSSTVGTSLTTLPFYGVLSDRRAVMVYNNSANTIYVGGSDVTTSNGMPVPAGSYSPILDAGNNVILYGIASTSSNNVRVMEISDEDSGR